MMNCICDEVKEKYPNNPVHWQCPEHGNMARHGVGIIVEIGRMYGTNSNPQNIEKTNIKCTCNKQPTNKSVYFTCPVHGNMIKGSEVAYVSDGYGYTNIVTPQGCSCAKDENNSGNNSWKCPYHGNMIKSGNGNIQVPDRRSAREIFQFAKDKQFDYQKEIDFKGHTALRLFFTDRSSVVIQSEYEGDLSDVTSDQGILPASFYVITHKV